MDTQLSPYLHFNGNCEEAMNFYKSVFGGELEISRFSDYAEAKPPEDAKPEGVMHSTLTSGSISFMASDGIDREVTVGTNISISLAGKDEAQLSGWFNGLAEGGEVTLPLAKQMWGDVFGMLTDKYGIHWMVNISAGDKAEAAATSA